ncbi:hypothetical protein [Andreprevotia lacus]|jgi:hypothetical protein|uniref:hypothetical protein n=1 Tax=Andreprevotia lacus TaxID=1121000 RepID=UPI0009FD0C4A|nr:hypothetical protein [Andreprevotia lacus]
MHAEFLQQVDEEWCSAPSIKVHLSQQVTRIARSVGITVTPTSALRVDICADGDWSIFDGIACACGLVAIGFSNALILIDPINRTSTSFQLDGYFSRIYPNTEETLEEYSRVFSFLVTSASELICISPSGTPAWRTEGLAIDGVVIHSIKNGLVHGSGEWDPPGGWQPFAIDLNSGIPASVVQQS